MAGTEMVSLVDEAAQDSPSRESGQSPSRVTKDYLLGIVLLLIVVFLWTSSNFVTQGLFEGGYHKPFLVTYLNTSSFTLYLAPFLIRYWWKRRRGEVLSLSGARGQYEALPVSDHETLENPPLYSARVPYVPIDPHLPIGDRPPDLSQLPPLTITETARLASIFCFFWFIANWSLNASLDYTSVASSTVLSGTSGFFTLVIGRLFSVETLSPTKFAAVITSFIGVLLVSLSDSSAPPRNAFGTTPITPAMSTTEATLYVYNSPLLGDLLAILAAVFYALYVILLKIRIHSESRIDMQLFFGFVGAFNIIALLPVGFILHFTGHELFELPSTGKSWGAVLVNMFITLSSDYIYVLAMLKTTPLVVTVGLSLTIPLAIVGDEILSIPVKAQAGLGALLVLLSFGLVGWENAGSGQGKGTLAEEPGQENPGFNIDQSGSRGATA